MLRHSLITSATFLLLFTIWSCGDSPSGPDLSEAPDAPTLDNVKMDFSIFEQADTFHSIQSDTREAIRNKMDSLPVTANFTAYEQAAWYAYFAELWFQTMGSLPSAFFQEHQWGDPHVDGDTWIWEWSFAAEGESIAMRITAETINNERHWELRYTMEGMDIDLDNALLIASQIRLDGSGGAWQLYDFFDENEDPTYLMEYELDGDITTLVDMRFDVEEDGRFLYRRDGDIGSLEMWDVFDAGRSILEWNNETGKGSIQSEGYRDGNRVCWDENFQDTEC